MWLALGVVGGILGFVTALLLLAEFVLEAVFSQHTRQLRLHCLGNTLSVDLRRRELSWWLLNWRVLRKPLKASAPKREEIKSRPSVSLQQLRRERRRLLELWRYLRRSVQIERLELDARLATPDPVWTGTLYALASSLVYPLKAVWPKARLRLRADFVHELPSGNLDVALKLRGFRLIVLGVKAFRLSRRLRVKRSRKEEHGSSRSTQGNRRGYAPSR